MDAEKPLTDGDKEWLKEYEEEVVRSFRGTFSKAGERCAQTDQLLERFTGALAVVRERGRAHFRAVDEAHNELCIAAALLENTKPTFSKLEYEPALAGSDKSIDFRATTEDGQTFLIDVKTIKPQAENRWDQYERARKEGWLPKNVRVILSEEWLGGEMWHYMFAARSRMLEYTLELEQKSADGQVDAAKTPIILVLCGEGFYWHESELEDFVSFYKQEAHRSDDPFSNAEKKYLEDKKITLRRTVTQFACMSRAQGEIRPKRLNWSVRPPADPAFV